MGLTQWLRQAADRRGDALALVFADKRFTWREFEDRVARLASVLRAAGVGPDERVAMLIVEQARDAEPVVLLVDESFAAQAAALSAAVPSFKRVILAGEGAAPEGLLSYEAALAASDRAPDAGRGGGDIAALFYTGGTTGRSKGVMLTHANLDANAENTVALTGFDETLVHLHAGPLFHLAAGGRIFSTTRVAGRHVVAARFQPEDVLDIIARERVTTATFVPTMLSMILQLPSFSSYDLTSLTRITYGASPMPESLLREALQRFPGVAFAQSYGMTELSPVATFLPPEEHRLDGRHLRSAGRAVPGVEVRVVDAADRPLPPGRIGEVVARGPTVMKGYWRQPELTAAALRGGWMHTGDAGYLDEDGFLYVVDRTKDMIVSGGENVYSTEVENAICRHPAVAQCAVIGIPDPKWGEAVHAIVVPRTGASLDAASVMSHCRELIAAYKCPRSVDVRDEPLPLSSVNKVNKAALRAPFWSGRDRQVN